MLEIFMRNISVNWFKCDAEYFMKFLLQLVLSAFKTKERKSIREKEKERR